MFATLPTIYFFLFEFTSFLLSLCSPHLSLPSLCQVGLCLGSKLESLALPASSITEASLLALLPRLTSLRRLDLRGLDSLFMSGAFLSREEHRQQVAISPDLTAMPTLLNHPEILFL